MSNKSTNGFKDYKQFQNMTLDEIRNKVNEQKEELKKDYKELRERKKLIRQYKKLTQAREKVRKGVGIKKDLKKPKPKTSTKKVKSFNDYFEECIKNKKIPKHTPPYFRKALERAIIEYNQGVKKEDIL